MGRLAATFNELGSLDQLATQDTVVHRLDPRAKVITTLCFLVLVVSFDKYALAPLLPFFLFPVALAAGGNIPASSVLKRLLLAAPFVLLMGIFNPLLDREIVVWIGAYHVTGGWLSFGSIVLRFLLTVGTVVVLVGVTGFAGLCLALERLRVPLIFVNQLLFMYRYLFVLCDEGVRLARARALRSFDRRGMGLQVASHLIGGLLLRTLDRAQRVHLAMLARGFTGTVKRVRPLHFRGRDAAFMIGWLAYFLAMRWLDLPTLLGRLLLEIAP